MNTHDVLVIGGGPAGCTAAALLAEKGWRVLLVEKEKMPRYHIGESLMPFCYNTLNRLGVIDKMKEMQFVEKLSVQFVGQDGAQSRPFYFFQHHDVPSSYTWQVTRSRFDHMLWENARDKGAQAEDGTRVTGFLQDEAGAVQGAKLLDANGNTREVRAAMTVDATGRDGLFSARKNWRVRDPQLNKIALWTYFKGTRRDPGLDAGATTVAYLPGKGWFWYIPLENNLTSVGIVAERDYLFRDPAVREQRDIFFREMRENKWIEEHLAMGECTGQFWMTGEFSYRCRHVAADGIVLAGDAFAFLDPVFSSGVFLALKSGEMVADAIDAALEDRDVSASRFDAYGKELCSHIETMRRIVYAFYDKNFSFGKLIQAHPEVRGSLTDCLIGDVSRNFAQLFEGIRSIAELPPVIDYGMTGERKKREMARV